MQDRYVGDVGDFGKYGLLRQLVGMFDGRPRLSLGVIWYKVPDESHNSDGSKVQYLEPGNAHRFEQCDPALYLALRSLVSTGRRHLADVGRAAILPRDTVFYDRVLHFRARDASDERLRLRQQWLNDALRLTEHSDLVFLDPDNGLQCKSVRSTHRLGPKYSFDDELRPIVERGQTLVAYHHTARQAPADVQIRTRLQRLADHFPSLADGIAALRFRRGNSRAFLIVPSSDHQKDIQQRVQTFLMGPWSNHFDLVTLSA